MNFIVWGGRICKIPFLQKSVPFKNGVKTNDMKWKSKIPPSPLFPRVPLRPLWRLLSEVPPGDCHQFLDVESFDSIEQCWSLSKRTLTAIPLSPFWHLTARPSMPCLKRNGCWVFEKYFSFPCLAFWAFWFFTAESAAILIRLNHSWNIPPSQRTKI